MNAVMPAQRSELRSARTATKPRLLPPSSGEERSSRSRAATDTNERDLVTRLREGDPEACAELVRTHTNHLEAVARRLLRCEHDASDAVQEAFICAFRSIGAFKEASRLTTWLHRIVVNAALMKLRERRRRAEVLIERLPGGAARQRSVGWDRIGWTVARTDALERQETSTIVRARIDALPDRFRKIVLLRDVEELSTQAAARALGITEAAVKTRLHRARAALRALLAPELS